jgi:hypothetical protein
MKRTLTLIVALAVAHGAAKAASGDGWHDDSSQDPMTGVMRKSYSTPATTLDGPPGLTGSVNVRCRRHEFQIFVRLSGFFSVRSHFWYWIEDGQIKGPFSASEAGDGIASFLDSEGDAIRLSRLLASQSDVRIRIRTLGGSTEIVLKPSSENAAEFIGRARSDCSDGAKP